MQNIFRIMFFKNNIVIPKKKAIKQSPLQRIISMILLDFSLKVSARTCTSNDIFFSRFLFLFCKYRFQLWFQLLENSSRNRSFVSLCLFSNSLFVLMIYTDCGCPKKIFFNCFLKLRDEKQRFGLQYFRVIYNLARYVILIN